MVVIALILHHLPLILIPCYKICNKHCIDFQVLSEMALSKEKDNLVLNDMHKKHDPNRPSGKIWKSVKTKKFSSQEI